MSDIKLFRLTSQAASEISGAAMALEKPLQKVFEKNLEALLNVRFLASEYSITDGRIDTLGLDENNCPVIIEYKRQANENVINQGLFYYDWLMDHQADFELLTIKTIGQEAANEIDWSAPRLVCIAANFTRYDEHAVKQIDRNIELIRYRKFGDDLLMLDLLTATTSRKPASLAKRKPHTGHEGNDSNILQSASEPELLGGTTLGQHDAAILQAVGEQKTRYEALADFMNSLGEDVQERHLNTYVAFKRIRNFACILLRNQRDAIIVFANINPKEIEMESSFTRDVTNIGHYGTGDLEITIESDEDLERAKPLIQKAYDES